MAEWYLDVCDSYAEEHFNKSLWMTVFVYIVTYVSQLTGAEWI